MKRAIYYFQILFFLLIANFSGARLAYAQTPETPKITSFAPAKAWFGEEVLILGSGFSSDRTDLKVKFGAAEAKILESGTTGIRVEVPAGATYAPITVTSSGLTAYSRQAFLLSFGGKENVPPSFDAAKQFTINPNPNMPLPRNNLVDVCVCDLDGDGKNDLIGSSQESITIPVYQNISTIGTLDFPTSRRFSFTAGKRTNFLSCGDLDGDGRPDLVFTGYSTDQQNVIVLKNNSTSGVNGGPGTISFGTYQLLSVPDKIWIKPAIHDLNGDGKPEIILTNETDATITVLKNISDIGSIRFDATPSTLSVSNEKTRGLRIKDVNNDGLPDITTSNSLIFNKAYFLLNTSSGGSIDFQEATEFTVSSNLYNHELEDFDGDGKPDLISLDLRNNKAEIFLNNGTGSSPSFSAAKAFTVGSNPAGLELGDFNGDKKTDILIGLNNSPMAYLLTNTSKPGDLTFVSSILSTSLGKFPNIQIADFDGDAKPDAVVADKEYNHFYIFRNKTCISPVIEEIVQGESVTLSTVQSPSSATSPPLSYQWYKDGALLEMQTNPKLENIDPGKYHVEIVSGCGTLTSGEYSFNNCLEDLGNPAIQPFSPICEGEALSLSVLPEVAGATYTWSNAATGFSQTTSSHTLNIEAADPALHAGTYTLLIESSCQLELQSAEVTIQSKPAPTISADGVLSICTGETKVLSVDQEYSSYQWKKDGTPIESATSSSFTASSGGSYSVIVTNTNGCEAESSILTVEEHGKLEAKFETPSEVCFGNSVQFQNLSTTASGKSVKYFWDFGDGSTSTEASPIHIYASPEGSPFTVSLTVEYENTNCSSNFTRPIAIVKAPEIFIEAVGPTEFCTGDSVKVQLSGNFASVKWSNGDTGEFTYTKEPGLLVAEAISSAGCTISKSVEFSRLDLPVLEITADKTLISKGESVQLQVSGGLSYNWEPAEGMDNFTIASPMVSPTTTTTYKVYGIGTGGCMAEAEITIEVDSKIVLETPKLFIPATDQTWRVGNVENYPDLSLLIVNKFGKTVYEASPYENNWDGTDHGNSLNEGVYFYVFKDATGNVIKTGSITLVR